MEQTRITELKQIATKVRLGILEATHAASSGHPGGSLSITDILTYLYFEEMNIDVNNLTPLEALNKLNEIKKIVKGK